MKTSGIALGAAVSLLTFWSGQACADTFDLSLTGVAADGFFSSQNIGSTHYDQWVLSLSGLDDSNAITVVNGDMIDVTITLDQPFTIPASEDRTNFALFLSGDSFPGGSVVVTGTTTFFDGASEVLTGSATTGTAGALANTVDFFPPDNGPITFTSVTSVFTINTLSGPATLDESEIAYTLVSTIPEPATWALMLIGFGGLGAAMRGRRRVSRAA